MKSIIYNIKGEKKGDVELPNAFNRKIRKDVALKYFEVDKFSQPYRPAENAGKKHSASGTISHKRHDWKGHYGKGISRIPRKTMSRRGQNFHWIGAEISSVRGGRRAHPPKGIGKEKKLNKKEIQIAMESGIAATADKNYLAERYSTLREIKISLPVIVESNLEKIKTKDFLMTLKKLFGENYKLTLKEKKVRAGKGKIRGRKYKSNAGILLVKSENENIKISGIDILSVREIEIRDLYPLGRIAIYTEKAIEELRREK
ncbi:MAG: 50S ribosomal protein L4 [Candidatus Pacearchaeota archaeon]|nr:50S ribosomal protein L4 [Candidatus Pacearchaeota archaeon]MDZ4226809.1 50S ribosomal protein L4 [Candidatus Pacearchaeota archaeon]